MAFLMLTMCWLLAHEANSFGGCRNFNLHREPVLLTHV